MTEQSYLIALEAWRIESARWRKAQEDYRARRIGDVQFLAAKAEFNAASAVLDHVEAAFKACQD